METLNSERIQNLGPAILSVTIPHAAFGKGPNGESWMYVVANGNPAVFSVIDVNMGDRVSSFLLEKGEACWGMTVDPFGNVYAGTAKGGLYRYVPGSDHVEAMGMFEEETHFWRIASDDDGRIYIGTYPGGKVLQFDPSTKAYIDFGQMFEGEQYVRSVAYGNGKIYAGTGSVRAQLFEIDPLTHEVKGIPFPQKYSAQKEVYDLNVHGNFLFARVTYFSKSSPLDNVTLVYDLILKNWVEEWAGTTGFDVSPPDDNNNVYFGQYNRLMAYNLDTRKLSSTDFDLHLLEATRGFGWFELDQPEFPGKSLVSTNMRGTYMIYNPNTGTGTVKQGKPQGAPINIHSLFKAHDGNIYIGGYLAPSSMARFHTGRRKMETLPGMSQVEGMWSFQNKIYMGVYPNAKLFEYDPELPWVSGVNPKKLPFPGTDYDQDRTAAFVTADRLLAIGTIPVAGRLGGALCLCDPEGSHYEIFRNVVKEQSILSLEYRDGFLFGGTTIFGGYGAVPTRQEGKLFIWDLKQGQKIGEMVPVPGEYSVNALRFDDDGLLWGMTNSCLFTFDPVEKRVVRTERLVEHKVPKIDLRRNVIQFYKDGYLYGHMNHFMFRMDSVTWSMEVLESGSAFLAQDDDGHLYFARRTDLHRLPYPAAAPSNQA